MKRHSFYTRYYRHLQPFVCRAILLENHLNLTCRHFNSSYRICQVKFKIKSDKLYFFKAKRNQSKGKQGQKYLVTPLLCVDNAGEKWVPWQNQLTNDCSPAIIHRVFLLHRKDPEEVL